MTQYSIPTVTFDHILFEDLIHGRTNNPVQESGVLDVLRNAIRAGFIVELTDLDGVVSSWLTLSDDGKFQVVPV